MDLGAQSELGYGILGLQRVDFLASDVSRLRASNEASSASQLRLRNFWAQYWQGNSKLERGGAFLLKRRGILYALTPAHNRGGTRRIFVQAVDTSSKSKGATGRQPFVEPQWLFPSNNENDGNNYVQESTSEAISSASQTKDRKQSLALYYIVIRTSKDDKSGFSEPSAGILLSMIGEDGNAIMHKIPGTKEPPAECCPRFQRGSVDIITVPGPDLGRLAALWIAPETGTWRLEKATVTILPWSEQFDSSDTIHSREAISDGLKELASMGNRNGVFHLFKSYEALLGKDSWLGAAELKPSVVHETSDLVDLQDKMSQLSPEQSRSSQGLAKLREDNMKEYENLKLSLLGFSSLLVAVGSASLASLGRGDLAEDFALGGVGGFLYLLLLQRAVDQLPSSTTADTGADQVELPISSGKEFETPRYPMEVKEGQHELEANSQKQGRSAGNVDGSTSISTLAGPTDIGLRGRIALVAGVALVLGRLAGGVAVSTISPPQLLAGIVGFLTSKVAVVLAALKPASTPGDK